MRAGRPMKLSTREALNGYLFFSPGLIGFLAFMGFPILFSLYLSFTSYNIYNAPKWIGWLNYKILFTQDTLFYKSLGNTLYYVALSVPLNTILGVLIAVLMNLWAVGGSMIVYLAGLQGVPRSLYEAATVDGAGRLRQFWNVTIPMLTPTIFFNVIMGVLGGFQVFIQAYIMTGGGPNNSTMFYALYLYNKAFKDLQMGYASAMAWVLLVVAMLLTLIIIKTSGKWVYYEGSDQK
ncbi:carbohydrate ABC transporter permease [Cohnella thermotolerans]|uniref:carbohydrate ABC transporter permease n=1 Tax=Cohnella thermotolerans TaxID=329858 RepID=UPI00040F12A1|nr:sugar ABC transporter permease [Cohnella thermotolerans]